jgi:hypothetical protein
MWRMLNWIMCLQGAEYSTTLLEFGSCIWQIHAVMPFLVFFQARVCGCTNNMMGGNKPS